MTLKESIEVLEEYNSWRRGAEIPMPEPKKIGEALEIAINMLKNLKQ